MDYCLQIKAFNQKNQINIVEIWKRNVEYANLISVCNIWCHTSRADVKTPIVEKCKQNQS